MIHARPEVISSIMGVYPPHMVTQMKEKNIRTGPVKCIAIISTARSVPTFQRLSKTPLAGGLPLRQQWPRRSLGKTLQLHS